MDDDSFHGLRRGSANAEQRWWDAARSLAEARQRNRTHNCAVLVEGLRDRRALVRLGFTGPIELLNRGWSVDDVLVYLVDTYGRRHVDDNGPTIIVLMDWDRTGGRLQNTCRRNLESLDVSFDESLHRTLLRCLKPETKTVEGISGLTDVLRPIIDQLDEDSLD
jgi:5S rRNA maturation endonuclease (ribonuclease M5)